MNFPLFIARKIYNGEGDGQKVSRPAIRIATIGVALGLAVMLVSVAVVLGFKHTIRDKVVGFGSDITVANFFTLQTSDTKPIQLNDSMMNVLKHLDGVKHVQRYAMTQGILKTDSDFLGVAFKGVGEEYDTAFLSRNMIEGSIPKFSGEKSGNKILVSKTMSDKLNIHAGSKVYGYFMTNDDVRMRKYTVSGVYQTNLSKYDEVMCFADLYSVVKLNGWEADQATGAELSIKQYDQLDQVLHTVTKKVNKHVDAYGETYCSATVEELNPQIFSWLDLLDLNVWIILGVEANPAQKILWESVLTCIIGPAATACPVITAKIGGNINTMTAFVVMSSFASALMIPAVFPLLERGNQLDFWSAFLIILQKLAMVLVAPLVLGWVVQHYAKRLCAWIVGIPDLSFYLWSVQLSVTSGVTVRNIVRSDAGLSVLLMIATMR